MIKPLLVSFVLALTLVLGATEESSGTPAGTSFDLKSIDKLELVKAKADRVTHAGRSALRLLPSASHESTDESLLAVIPGRDFKDGTIEAEIAGVPRVGAPADARGFVGIAFRVQPHGSSYECFYLRPTNARAEDQVRRNHTTQYVSEPEFPWYRLRKEFPRVYESYVDLDPNGWTRIKIVVSGKAARLYVNDAQQPSLVVTDLKHGETRGQIALWSHSDTEAYFSYLRVR